MDILEEAMIEQINCFLKEKYLVVVVFVTHARHNQVRFDALLVDEIGEGLFILAALMGNNNE